MTSPDGPQTKSHFGRKWRSDERDGRGSYPHWRTVRPMKNRKSGWVCQPSNQHLRRFFYDDAAGRRAGDGPTRALFGRSRSRDYRNRLLRQIERFAEIVVTSIITP